MDFISMENPQKTNDDDGDLIINDTDYVQEAENLVLTHNQINIENALVLNKQMRIYLVTLREEVERLLNRCRAKYQRNEEIMKEVGQKKSSSAISTTYYFCGYPYFKDRSGTGAPLPAEYYQRRDKKMELFPIDLLDKRTFWLPRDKMDLVQGVKKQVVSFLQTKNRDRIRQSAEKRCASDITLRLHSENESLSKMHLSALLKKAEVKDFHINWMDISLVDMDDRHSDNECIAMWNNYLMPSLNRKQWTDEEEEQLLAAAEEHKAQNWSQIARQLINRSAFQCFVHFRTVYNDHGVARNARWTPDEDKNLINFIDKYRIGNVIPWTKIMDKMPGRSKLQLYNRYMFTLHPQINRSPFTTEEDCILMAAIKEYGENFRNFPPNLLSGRNMKQIRSRYNNVLKFVKVRDHWSEEHDIKLMALIDKYGSSDWVKIANEMVNHNRTSCRQRYITIRNFLDKHPDRTIADVPRRKKAFSSNVTTDNWMETIIRTKKQELLATDDDDDDDDDNDHDRDSDGIDDERLEKNSKYFASNSFGAKCYHFFKYSFNFQMYQRMPPTDSVFENIQIAAHLLQAPAIPFQMDVSNDLYSNFIRKVETSKKVQLETDLLTSLSQLGKSVDFLFPVNANTVLGLRGLVTMFETKPLKKENNKPKSEPFAFDQHEALNLFRMRFKSIFQNTASVAKLTDHMPASKVLVNAKKRKRKTKPKAIEMKSNLSSTTTNLENDETIVSGVVSHPSATTSTSHMNDIDHHQIDFTSVLDSSSNSNRITVLESITIGFGSQNNTIFTPQPSTVPKCPASHSMEQYTVAVQQNNSRQSDPLYQINIQPYHTSNMQHNNSNTSFPFSSENFIVWNPTQSDEATE